jgi:glyoxylase-like metal-dependent hydrolase (beta-lactamase superfamily II)
MNSAADWHEVGDRVFTRRYAYLDQQIGVVLGQGEALVIDTRATLALAGELIADLRRLSRDPVTVAVNTHWHWDHAFGNSVFRPAVIWGHERCRERLLADGATTRGELAVDDPARRADFEAVVIDPPERTLMIAADVDVGGRRVELRYLGRGHTDGDIVVLIPDTQVLFAGDLLEEGATPNFGDGYPIDWPVTIERLLPLASGLLVPGHGAVGDRSFVERQLEAFRAVAAVARRLDAGELDREAAIASMPFDEASSAEPLDRALAQLRGDLD